MISTSKALLSPRLRSIMVKEPRRRKITNMSKDAGASTNKIQIKYNSQGIFLISSGLKVSSEN